MEKKKFLDGTEIGEKKVPARKNSDAQSGAATAIDELSAGDRYAVSGGLIRKFYPNDDSEAHVYLIIDDVDGSEVEMLWDLEEAERWARAHGYSSNLTW